MTIPFSRLDCWPIQPSEPNTTRSLRSSRSPPSWSGPGSRRTIAVGTGRANGNEPVCHRSTGERPNAPEHQDALALRRGDRQQIPRAAVCGVRTPFCACDRRRVT